MVHERGSLIYWIIFYPLGRLL